MGNKYKFFLFILVLLVIPNIKVNASTKQFNVCFNDNGLYSITYDDSINTAVNKNQITFETVKNGHLNYPNGIEDVRYKFTAVQVGGKCYMSGDTIKMCPTNSNSFDKIQKAYIVYGTNVVNVSDKVDMNFNLNTGKFDITIKDQFNNQYDIRYVQNREDDNTFNSASAYAGQFLNRSGNGTYFIGGVDANHAVDLEFYQKSNDGCNGVFIGRIVFFTPSLDEVEIDNPAVSNPASYGCDQVKAYVPTGIKASDASSLNALKKNVVNLCYEKTITYNQYLSLRNTISNNYNSLRKLFSGFNITTAGGSNTCSGTYHGGTAMGYSSSGSYWAMSCVENFSASGDAPKLVSAGGGFSYSADFTITRSCNLVQHTVPVMKPQCVLHCDCHCSWHNSRTGASGEGDEAGPNDSFDTCVNTCDGGKYTQSCVNSCYSKVYSKTRNTSSFESFSLDTKKNSRIEFTASMSIQDAFRAGLVTRVPTTTSFGNVGYKYTTKGAYAEGDCECSESNWCANGNGGCSLDTWVGPSGCVDDPVSVYQQELAIAAAEHAELQGLARGPIDIGDYEMTITDSYINDGTFKLKLSSNTDPALMISNNQAENGDGRVAHVHVTLPLSYVNKITGDATYRSNSSSQPYALNSKVGRLEAVNNFNENNFYFKAGERKYYTSVNSRNTNVGFNNGKAVLTPNSYNIEVTAKNVGWAKFSSTNQCYYGVYNGFYNFKDATNNCNPITEICDGGIQYIFRPIVLGDVFPNGRAPRYNWSSAATGKGSKLYNATVDPVKYTQNIQTKQETIYDTSSGEIDYEFILTPKSIAAIKAYNKSVEDFNKDGAKNYLDYDLSCYTRNGREVCTSRFLDKTDILMYGSGYTVDQRKSIAGCNNARDNGTACDTSAHQ